MFDCTCNTQNSLLLNQHNGDDAPLDYWNVVLFFVCCGAAYLDTVPATQNEDQHQYVITLETWTSVKTVLVSENTDWLVAARNVM